MVDECIRRGLPGLTAQVADIETADLGREKYDMALADLFSCTSENLKVLSIILP
jgi:hypothetical protein